MIQFILKQQSFDEQDVTVTVSTHLEHLEGVVEAFKTFLHHVGHHPTNIERIVLQGPEERQGLPQQLELFPDDRPRGEMFGAGGGVPGGGDGVGYGSSGK